YSEQAMETRLEIISRCTEDKGMATAFLDGEPAGVGLGVTDGDWLGLFSIITLPKLRRRGVAKSVSSGLASWGQSKGATRAFLQVETDNLPARKLYKEMGFQISYEYWYRRFVAE
ncbi:GNAT family N-acetyltransferase, partial [Candidatus Thorarchaeota archaeon]